MEHSAFLVRRLTPYLGTWFTLNTAMKALTIGGLARLGGVNLETVRFETVRYYERRGLLPKPPRTQAGYRQFPPDTAERSNALRNWAFRSKRWRTFWRCEWSGVKTGQTFARAPKPRLPISKAK